MGNDTGDDNDTYRSLLMALGEKQLQSMASDNVVTCFHPKKKHIVESFSHNVDWSYEVVLIGHVSNPGVGNIVSMV